jgi:hypothetical protein
LDLWYPHQQTQLAKNLRVRFSKSGSTFPAVSIAFFRVDWAGVNSHQKYELSTDSSYAELSI